MCGEKIGGIVLKDRYFQRKPEVKGQLRKSKKAAGKISYRIHQLDRAEHDGTPQEGKIVAKGEKEQKH